MKKKIQIYNLKHDTLLKTCFLHGCLQCIVELDFTTKCVQKNNVCLTEEFDGVF